MRAAPGPTRFSAACVALALGVAALLLYGRSCAYDFTMDDPLVTAGNRDVAAFDGNAGRFFTTSLYAGTELEQANCNLYRPLLKLSMVANRALAGGSFNPRAFHAVNVALYAACVAMAFLLLLALCRDWVDQPLTVAGLAAALFLVLPSHLESVCNIKHREEIMACLFGLAAWRVVLAADARRAAARYATHAAAALLFLAALLSKESALLLLPCMLLAAWAAARRCGAATPSVPAWLAPFAIALVVYFALRVAALGSLVSPAQTWLFFRPGEGVIVRAGVGAGVFAKYYLWDQFVTLRLDPAFSSRFLLLREAQPSAANVLAAVALLAAFVAAAWRFARTGAAAAYWVLFAFITAFFAANLIPLGSAGAFRLVFTPSLGLCVALVLGLRAAAGAAARRVHAGPEARRALPVVLPAALIAVYAAVTWQRMDIWRNDGSLFAYSAALEPANAYSAKAAGEYFEKRGQHDRKLDFYRQSLAACLPHAGNARVLDDRGTDLFSIVATEVAYSEAQHQPARAVELADIAIAQFARLQAMRGGALDTNVTAPYYVKALALQKLGRTADSIATCRAGLALAPHAGLTQLLSQAALKDP